MFAYLTRKITFRTVNFTILEKILPNCNWFFEYRRIQIVIEIYSSEIRIHQNGDAEICGNDGHKWHFEQKLREKDTFKTDLNNLRIKQE